MEICVYDFDETVYDGDSTVDFYKFCLKKFPGTIRFIPFQLFFGFLYLIRIYPKTKFKDKFYRFLKGVPDIDGAVSAFWREHIKKIKPWYGKKNHGRDVIISASPEFLLGTICGQLGVQKLIASKVDKFTGKCLSENCWGPEKVRRLNIEYSDYRILEFYSDSHSDDPLAEIALKSFLVRGNLINPWE